MPVACSSPAQSAFVKAVQDTSADEIISGAKRYADDPYRHPTFTPHPSTWLNQGRWADEALPPRDLTPEEKRANDLKISEKRKAKDEAERAKLQQEWQEADRTATKGIPDNVKELLNHIRHSKNYS